MEKFREVSKITTKLASLASEEAMGRFTARCALLKDVISAWEKGINVKVIEGIIHHVSLY